MANITELRFIANLLRQKQKEWGDETREHFVMTTWSYRAKCGYAGCAIGTYIHYAEDRAKLIGLSFDSASAVSVPKHVDGATNLCAVAVALGISVDDAYDLFNPDAYDASRWNDPIYVARRIDDFCDAIEAGGAV